MSETFHEAIVVTSHDPRLMVAARNKAADLGLIVTGVFPSKVNLCYSMAVMPDGSKEGWDDAEKAEKCRRAFVEYLKERKYPEGDSMYEWGEIRYGRDYDAKQREEQAPVLVIIELDNGIHQTQMVHECKDESEVAKLVIDTKRTEPHLSRIRFYTHPGKPVIIEGNEAYMQ